MQRTQSIRRWAFEKAMDWEVNRAARLKDSDHYASGNAFYNASRIAERLGSSGFVVLDLQQKALDQYIVGAFCSHKSAVAFEEAIQKAPIQDTVNRSRGALKLTLKKALKVAERIDDRYLMFDINEVLTAFRFDGRLETIGEKLELLRDSGAPRRKAV